jgi:hypothetical protein
VVYGDDGNAWILKSEFICGYLSAVLPGHRQSIIDVNHCHTYEAFTFTKMNLALKVYGGSDPALQDKRIEPSPGFCLSIPVTQQMKRLVSKAYLMQSKSSSCQLKSVI